MATAQQQRHPAGAPERAPKNVQQIRVYGLVQPELDVDDLLAVRIDVVLSPDPRAAG